MALNARARSWNSLSEDAQLALACQALHRAAESIVAQAECLAGEMEDGNLADRGGAEALRMLVAVVRATSPGPMAVVGNA